MTRRSKDDWRKLIEQQSNSHLSVAEFCQQHQLGQTYFYKQRSELRKPAQPSNFIKICPQKNNSIDGASIKLQYQQSELRLPVSISPAWLAEFIKALA